MPSDKPTVLSLLRLLPESPETFRTAVDALIASGDQPRLDRLFVESGYHGVSGVIDRRLSAQPLPPPLADRVLRRIAVEEIWEQHLRGTLEDVAYRLNQAGIVPVALKGPVLGARFYSPAATRYCVDLDILVRDTEFESASEVMIAAGFEPEDGLSAAYHRRYSHHLEFAKSGAPLIEVHFRAYAGFGVNIDSDAFLGRAQPWPLGRATVAVLAPEDECIYLAAHAAGHSFTRLVWLHDLKLLLTQSAVDWQIIDARARALGLFVPVMFAMMLLERWLGFRPAGVPRPALGVRAGLAAAMVSTVARLQERGWRDNLEGLVFTALLCDRVGASAWLVTHHSGRALRRRLKQVVPGLLPDHWAS